FLSSLFYAFPSKKIKVVGVTGTNGKSTTVFYISKILEEAGYRVAVSCSIFFKIKDEEWQNKLRMTMPGRFFLQSFLKKAVKKGCQYAIIEVTSEGIKQYRHSFIDFNCAIFTNLYPEHIEAHGSFEKYRQAKEKLFEKTKTCHILNFDDKEVSHFLKYKAQKKYFYSLNKENNYFLGENEKLIQGKILKKTKKGFFLEVGKERIHLKIPGDFQAYNALAAISFGLDQNIDLKTIKRALEKISFIPGRMEKVISQPFEVIVDYAFTPNALEKVYLTLKENLKKKNKMICVLGACGGGRDKWKRPVLGALAQKYCQKVIITNEDPYDEDPWEIIKQVAKGSKEAEKILDRREAIKKALKMAQKNDIVIITGKGSEPSICLEDGKKIPWDDRQVVREEFKKLKINEKEL
ncbi:MAG: UDP-N-acetylmuramoyl-L-alanyl-D-glutamate--2,6-diaminopimelate ligase, partial [Minisyncoccales bacterium]